jgi:hypothetical protein
MTLTPLVEMTLTPLVADRDTATIFINPPGTTAADH